MQLTRNRIFAFLLYKPKLFSKLKNLQAHKICSSPGLIVDHEGPGKEVQNSFHSDSNQDRRSAVGARPAVEPQAAQA